MLSCSWSRQQKYLTTLLRLVAGILVMIVLLCLTAVFKNMPQNAQAAVIIAAVIGLFRYDEWLFLWKVACLKPFIAHDLTSAIWPADVSILSRPACMHMSLCEEHQMSNMPLCSESVAA